MPEGIGYGMKVDLEPAVEKKKPKIEVMSLKQATKKAALSALDKKKKKDEQKTSE